MPWEVNNAGVHMSFPGGNAMFNVYNAELQLSQVHYGEVRAETHTHTYNPRMRMLTKRSVCAQDMKAAGLQTPSQTPIPLPLEPSHHTLLTMRPAVCVRAQRTKTSSRRCAFG